MSEAIFELRSAGYQPVLAHPERYLFIQDAFDEAYELKHTGLYFQLNLMSLTGHYSREARQTAKLLIKNKLVDFVGSDIHHEGHVPILKKAMTTKLFRSLRQLPLLNHAL